jgi:hypothetical protein
VPEGSEKNITYTSLTLENPYPKYDLPYVQLFLRIMVVINLSKDTVSSRLIFDKFLLSSKIQNQYLYEEICQIEIL